MGIPPHHAYASGRPTDEVTISRPLFPQESVDRGRAAYWAAAWPILGYVVGGLVLVLVIAFALIDQVFQTQGIFMALFILLVAPAIVIGLAIGIPVGSAVTKRRAQREIGMSHILTAAWNSYGVRISGENLARSLYMTDIRKIRLVRGFAVLKLRWGTSMWNPWVVALPTDFVPPAILHRFGAT
ncbi:MAG: hypothetical protein ACK5H2_06485 [Beutenbergiaceae bacterium]